MATGFLKILSNGNKILKSKLMTVPSYMIIFNFSFLLSIVHITSNEYENEQSARVVNYVKGLLFDVVCYDDGLEGSSGDISINRRIYAHRAIPEVLVQEIKITNPTGN